MLTRLLNYLRGQTLALVAIVLALGGGGGYAIAATTHSNTIHACVSKKNGAVYIAKRCTRSTRTLVFNQRGPAGAAGAAAVSLVGQVQNGGVVSTQGVTIAPTSTGVYNVTVTGCPEHTEGFLVASPFGSSPSLSSSESSDPVVDVSDTTQPNSFQVTAGNIENGVYTPTDQGFTLLGACE